MTAPSLFDFPGMVHTADPETSVEAASDSVRLGGQRLACLVALAGAADGLTPHEGAELTPCAYPHVVSTRFADLRRLGLAERTADTRPTPTGHRARVWVATVEGRRVAVTGIAQ